MDKIETHLSFVKGQVAAQERLAKKWESDAYRQGMHLRTSQSLRELVQFLETIKEKGDDEYGSSAKSVHALKRIQLTLADIEDLPEELIKELNITETDRQELVIENIIAKAGGYLSLDKIMVELYRRTGEITKRTTLVSRLYRMGQKGMIFNVPGKKGVYSTFEMSEQDAKRMFGQFDGEVTEEAPPSPSPPSSDTQTGATERLRKALMSSSSSTGVVRRG